MSTATYIVSDEADSNDVGMYLRAEATYDRPPGPRNKTAAFVSPHPVRPAKLNQNSLPEFAPTSIERDVQEGGAGMEWSVRSGDGDGRRRRRAELQAGGHPGGR